MCGLYLDAERQIYFDVSVQLQPDLRFELRNNPARLLAAADLIGEGKLLSAFCPKLNGVDRMVRVAPL